MHGVAHGLWLVLLKQESDFYTSCCNNAGDYVMAHHSVFDKHVRMGFLCLNRIQMNSDLPEANMNAFLIHCKSLMNTSNTALMAYIATKIVWLRGVSHYFMPDILEMLIFRN